MKFYTDGVKNLGFFLGGGFFWGPQSPWGPMETEDKNGCVPGG